VSAIASLSALAFFKYFNFGVENYNALMELVGLSHLQWDTFFRITLPLGISFYTFQSLSYAVDVYRGDAKYCQSFLDFACFVAMFPQLVAGPIVRFREVAAQLTERMISLQKFARGVSFVGLGLAKKVLLADSCGKIADVCFDAGSIGAPDAWLGALGYAFQIYFDFSAYSDMAIGLGLMLGFVFPKNFDSPYLAQSITELWQRWHLSLSTWLRDYLYIPLGGNRKGTRRTYVNLATVMLLGGLWHGASWNFVIWGGIHGAVLALERMQGKKSLYSHLPKVVKIGITFLITLVAWVFFRARDLPSALSYLASMAGLGEVDPTSNLTAGFVYQPYYLLFFALAVFTTWWLPQTWDFTRRLTWPKAAFCAVALTVALLVMVSKSYNPFIYFIF
jgi:alginate O-acetyltransferase complex protein AlgI